MAIIKVLNQTTIDKIAAGEVVERPLSVVKELVENAIDALASSITIEIKEGGISLIRVTDNGQGITPNDIPTAFLRHATSKITTEEDLHHIHSLGFRGEALSSIAAVSQIELITKAQDEFIGSRYLIEGGVEKELSQVGAPDGTTFLVHNLFFNTPARKKFLKSSQTEASYVIAMVEHIALSHPEIHFEMIVNGQNKIHTPGNNNLKDSIYQIFGREFVRDILSINYKEEGLSVTGFIGKPVISRGNRSFENFFVNQRYVKSQLLSMATEEAYSGFMMQHKYPFVVLYLTLDTQTVDVNVHPTKMELRFSDSEKIYNFLRNAISEALHQKELIPDTRIDPPIVKPEKIQTIRQPEPFELKRKEEIAQFVRETSPYERKYTPVPKEEKPVQQSLFEEKLLEPNHLEEIRIVGQVFDTYWIVEYSGNLYIIDQHAAHERILFEHTMKQLKSNQMSTQTISPPIVITLNALEQDNLKRFEYVLSQIGYSIEHFGGDEFAIRGIPYNMVDINTKDLFMEMIDELNEIPLKQTADLVLERVAMMSCKAAVKGNQKLSTPEIKSILAELLNLENPYSCPHGRPTIIKLSKNELEKKFKRII